MTYLVLASCALALPTAWLVLRWALAPPTPKPPPSPAEIEQGFGGPTPLRFPLEPRL
jgi:hypothetical protein